MTSMTTRMRTEEMPHILNVCVLGVLLRALTRWRSVPGVCDSGSWVGDPPAMYKISPARPTGACWDSRPLSVRWGHGSILSRLSHPCPTGFIHQIHYLLARGRSKCQVRPWPLPTIIMHLHLKERKWCNLRGRIREEVMSFKNESTHNSQFS